MSNLGPFFAPVQRIGGDHGHPFTDCGWDEGKSGLVVKRLDVWYNSSGLRGIQIAYSDHSRSRLYGNKSDSHGKIVFQPGERVVSMKLWSNGISTGISKRTGHIRLRTDSGQVLDVGKDITGQNPHIIDVGGGTLVGMVVSCGSDIHNLGAIFLKSAVTRVVITKIVLTATDLAATQDGIENVVLEKVQHTNNSTRPTRWKFSGKKSETKLTKSTSYIKTTHNTFGESVSVEVAAKPVGIRITEHGGFELEQHSQQTTRTSDTIEVNWEESGQLNPGESITCTAFIQRRKVCASYESMVTIMLEDGSKNTYPDLRGQFEAYAYTEVKTNIAPSSVPRVQDRSSSSVLSIR